MPRTLRCWANVLDDCDGKLEQEHCISIAAMQHSDPFATRKQKEKILIRHGIYRESGSRAYNISAAKLSARMLCHGHNSGTSDLDAASGTISDAIAAHCDVTRVHPLTNFDEDGALVERWFMKWAIDLIVGYSEGTRVGSATAEIHRPTHELAQMVFGRRPVREPYGMWFVHPVGNADSDDLTAHHWGPDGVTHGTLFSIRGFRFIVSLADQDPPWAMLGDMMLLTQYESVRHPRHLWTDSFGPSLSLRWPVSLPMTTIVRD